MKKLFLLLLTVCASVTRVVAGNDANAVYEFNPYAYDLTSTWNENTSTLTVNFKLNSAPNLDSDKGARGMQIFAVDSKNNRYYILGPSEANIKASGKGKGPYSFNIDLSSGYDRDGKQIPFNEDLTWEVTVAGRPSTISGYNTPRYWNWSTSSDANYKFQKRFISQGIAINTNPQSPNFGRIYITDGIKVAKTDAYGDAHGSTFYSYAKGRGVYILEPDFFTFGNNGNPSTIGNTADRKNGFVDPLEPWCIRTTDDGRVFVSSYSKTSATAVWELTSNAPYYSNWNAVLKKSDIGNRRVIGMDVKGSGNQLTLLVLCQGSGKELKCYEINLGASTQYSSSVHTLTEKKVPSSINFYEEGINGEAKVSYGNGGAIWYSFGFKEAASKLYRVKADGTTTLYSYGSNYGGEGFLIKNNLLIKGFRTGSNNSGIYIYGINNDNPDATASYTVPEANTIGTGSWITDFALDYANNLYAASSYYGRVIPISLPYSGTRTTRAQTRYQFRLKPVPNILATDLECTPHERYARYIFSFNVNTKPEGAELRFYTTEAAMLADCNQNEAYDRYNDHTKCSYYYRFENGELKQGRMSVELGILGHDKNDPNLADKKLPAGELYWNVFLKTRKSKVFAPIYIQPLTDASSKRTHYRLHATVDNNPENGGFGHIYAIDYKLVNSDATMKDNLCKLMRYTIGDAGVDDNTNAIESSTRYALIDTLSTDEMVQPRRPAVAPDGMVYLTDYGDYRYNGVDFTSKGTGPNEFIDGGIWLFNPNDPYKDAGKTAAKLSRFYQEDETVSDVYFYHDGSNLKLYKTNTYEEYSHHGTNKNAPNDNYQASAWQKNGYRIYTMGYNQDGTIKHSAKLTDGPVTAFIMEDGTGKVGGDANGSISVRVTKNGVWFCQNRKGLTVGNDNRENVSLMFYTHAGQRTFQSFKATVDGVSLSQNETNSLMKSTPGAGMTVSDDGQYIYVVNHECNILRFTINGTTTPTLSSAVKYVNRAKFNDPNEPNEGISTLNFDYAGNLIATVDQDYPCDASEKSRIVIFTVPYPDRDNARSIPASKSERFIPERLSQDVDNTVTLDKKGTYALDLYRPLQGATYNTICLPFDLDLNTLTTPHKLYGAKAMEFTGVSNPTVGGEEVLCLNFTSVTQLQAGIPYIIYVENHVRGLIEFDQITMSNTDPQIIDPSSSVTYTGVYNPTPIGVGNTILVDQNRLANVTNEGTLSGFRGYFTIPESLRSLKAMISTRHDTPTGLEDMNITERTYQKFLREGRVYIRVGEALYTITGEKVE